LLIPSEVVHNDEIGEVIRARNQMVKELCRREERFRAVFDGAAIGIAVFNIDGRSVESNWALQNMLGYSREELRAMVFTEFAHPVDAEAVRRHFREVIDGKRDRHQMEHRFIRKDGREIWGRLTVSFVRDTSKERSLAIGMVEDITNWKILERQFYLAQKMEAIGKLAGGVAHDFNNLLTVILGYSELALQKLGEGQEARADIEGILRAGKQAASLTRQLLAFGRRQVLCPEILDLNTVLAANETMLRRVVGERIAVEIRFNPSLQRIKADRAQIEQSILNLVINARDAMPKGGSLIIETANVDLDEAYVRTHESVKPGSYVMLALSDTGAGMTPEVQAHVFEPFFTTKELGKGTGLGLAAVYGIVKQSGGYIWVYSEPDRGTTFKIYFPATEERATPPPPSVKAKDLSGTETILLVEDDQEIREITRKALIRFGYVVLSAGDPWEAESICQRYPNPIHLLLTDVVMPRTTGSVLADGLLKLRPAMKVLYMSGYTDDAITANGVLEVGVAFLAKPFAPEVLARKVREVLAG
jgi:PAS domain S-box-containing protein